MDNKTNLDGLSEEDKKIAKQVEEGIMRGRERIEELRGVQEPTGYDHTGLGNLIHQSYTIITQYPEIITNGDNLEGEALEASKNYQNIIEELNRRGSRIPRKVFYGPPTR